jgi:hypothetical protein
VSDLLSRAERDEFDRFCGTYSLEEPAPLDVWLAARSFYLATTPEQVDAAAKELIRVGHIADERSEFADLDNWKTELQDGARAILDAGRRGGR